VSTESTLDAVLKASPGLKEMAPKKGGRKVKEKPEAPAIPPEALRDAQQLYIRYTPIERISQVTGISCQALQELVYNGKKGWKVQRELLQKEKDEEVRAGILGQLKMVVKGNLDLIQLGMMNYARECKESGQAPTLQETELLTRMFERLNKSKSLEEINAAGEKGLGITPEEVIRELARDPYMRQALEGNFQARPLDTPEAGIPDAAGADKVQTEEVIPATYDREQDSFNARLPERSN
jgi:hypothetical protein